MVKVLVSRIVPVSPGWNVTVSPDAAVAIASRNVQVEKQLPGPLSLNVFTVSVAAAAWRGEPIRVRQASATISATLK
jgi:hypothetical protein